MANEETITVTVAAENMLQNIGFSKSEAKDMAIDLAQRSADLEATYGIRSVQPASPPAKSRFELLEV